MALNEFDIIRRYFAGPGGGSAHLKLGVGDDCALLAPSRGHQFAVSTDTLVAGVHFPADADAALLARRCLRVNLSDLASMGAEPLGFLLALTLPGVDEQWLSAFSRGLAVDAEHYACPLAGGDTTRGPLSITLTVMGQVPPGRALLRSGAKAGDLLYVTGFLGDARGGLQVIAHVAGDDAGDCDYLRSRYWCPEPRLRAGRLLRDYASAAIDISDGLLQDAGHIAAQSGLGGRLYFERLPLSPQLVALKGEAGAAHWALTGGDDYELCFAVPPARAAAAEAALRAAGDRVTCVGELSDEAGGLHCVDAQGNRVEVEEPGYVHF